MSKPKVQIKLKIQMFKKESFDIITLAIIKVTSGYKFQTAAYRTDFS